MKCVHKVEKSFCKLCIKYKKCIDCNVFIKKIKIRCSPCSDIQRILLINK